MTIGAAPFLAQGAKGAEQAGTPVLSILALDPIEGIPQLDTLAAEAVPIRTLLPRQLSDTATILYTSGTTGKSKEGGSRSSIPPARPALSTPVCEPVRRSCCCRSLTETPPFALSSNPGARS